MKPNHYFKPYTKINSKCIKDLNIRPDMIKFLEENLGSELLGISLHDDFLDLTQKQRQQKQN